MVNYQLGKIYKIVDMTNENVYIGSTCEPTLARRLAGHIQHYKRYLNNKAPFVSSFDIIANGNYDIELIENFPCDNKDELHAREGYYAKLIPCVNRAVAGRTQQQYYQDKKDVIQEYREKNKEKLQQQNKQYRLNNKDRLREYDKERNSIQTVCECGGSYTGSRLKRHQATAKHLNYLQNKN